MENIQYRVATVKDLPTLLDFEQGIINFERTYDGNLKYNTTYYDLKEMIDNPNVKLVVAHIGETLIGSGYAKIVDAKPYHKNSQYAYMGFMYLKAEYRGKGIIQNIINELKNWAKSKNIVEARLEVYNDNVNAIKAYHKQGFKNHMIEMKMKL